MSLQALRWVPNSGLELATRELGRSLQAWAQHWGLPQEGLQPRVTRLAATPASDDVHRSGLVRLTQQDALPTAWRTALAQGLFRHLASGSAIADGVIARVTADLWARLGLPEGPLQRASEHPCPPGDRGLRAEFMLGSLACCFDLDLSALEQRGWIPTITPPPLPAVELETLCASLPVQLEALVGRAHLAVPELLALAPGDVLLLDALLSAPMQVQSQDRAVQFTADLGRGLDQNPQRALRARPAA